MRNHRQYSAHARLIVLPHCGSGAAHAPYLVLKIMQSVFRSAARWRSRQARKNPERRGGELKTGWTEPLHNSSAYGF
jgi:hypothetical protein